MDDDRFFGDMAILTEASRINPVFAAKVEEAGTDEQVDRLVEEGRRIIDEESDQAFV